MSLLFVFFRSLPKRESCDHNFLLQFQNWPLLNWVSVKVRNISPHNSLRIKVSITGITSLVKHDWLHQEAFERTADVEFDANNSPVWRHQVKSSRGRVSPTQILRQLLDLRGYWSKWIFSASEGKKRWNEWGDSYTIMWRYLRSKQPYVWFCTCVKVKRWKKYIGILFQSFFGRGHKSVCLLWDDQRSE